MPSSSSVPPSETLFKSSLRDSARTRPGPSSTAGSNADQWPPSMNASHLDPSQWAYLAEGGKNLLLRFDGDLQAGREAGWVNANGSRALALRLVKSEREQGASSSSSSTSGSADSLPPRPNFEAAVIAPLLGKEHILPPTARISLEGEQMGAGSLFLKKVAARIELARPVERRRVAGVDLEAGFVDVVEDLTWAAPGDEVLAVEIKPKWLFPTGKYSRYKKHRVLKSQGQLTLEQWNALYDPLDLVSGNAERIQKATEALVQDWESGGNNLRVFVGGQAVRDAKSNDLQRLLSGLYPQSNTTHTSSSQILVSLLKDILSTSDTQAVLQRLAHLQSSLAPLDIQTLSTWWRAQTGGQALGQEGGGSNSSSSPLSAPPSLEEYREFAQDWLQLQPRSGAGDDGQQKPTSSSSSSVALTLRQAVLGTLLSATFKDCSLFLRLGPEQEDMTPSTSTAPVSTSTAGGAVENEPRQELQTQSLTSVTENSSAPAASSTTTHSLAAALSASASTLLGGSSSYLDPNLVGPHVGERNTPREESEGSGRQTGAAATVGHMLRIIDVDAKPLRKLNYWLELEGQLEEAFELWKDRVGLPETE